MTRACRCIPAPWPDGDGGCIRCGKPLAFDHDESVRNRKLAEHSMKQRRKQDAGLKLRFAKEQAEEKAKADEMTLFGELMQP